MKAFLSLPNRRVLFFDEGQFGLKTDRGRCWAPKAVRPYSLISIGYKNFYVYTSVCPHTSDSFSLFLPWVNTEIMTLYLQQLSAAYPDKELMLIMNQAGWHGANDLQVPRNIQIELLPPYSPEFNPV